MSASPTPWKNTVRPPQNGEAVDATVADRAHIDQSQRTQYLKDVLSHIEAGQALILWDQPLTTSLVPGNAVYLDNTTRIWKPGRALFTDSGSNGVLSLDPQASVTGVVLYKQSPTLGVIVLNGTCILPFSQFALIVEGSAAAGVYYLSATTPGKLTGTKPKPAVPVATVSSPTADGNVRLFVNLLPNQNVDSHTHLHVPLAAKPSGIPNCSPAWFGPVLGADDPAGPYPDFRHAVTELATAQPGWLPADHSSFTGLIKPAGAKFGYNIAADPVLGRAFWSSVASSAPQVTVNGINVTGTQVVVNSCGIWWMHDEWSKAPWSPNYLPCSGSGSSSSGTDNPDTDLFKLQIDLWLTQYDFGTPLLVTSLVAADRSVVITDAAGSAAVSGALSVKVRAPTATADEAGFNVVKALDLNAGTQHNGPVVGGLKSLSADLVLSGGVIGGDGFVRGNLSLRIPDRSVPVDLDVDLVAVNNVQEARDNNVLMLRFPATTDAEIRGHFNVGNFLGSGQATLRFWLLAESADIDRASLQSTLTFSTKVLPQAATAVTLGAQAEITGSLNVGTGTLAAGTYVQVETAPFDVSAGASVYFTLRLNSPAANVGVLRTMAHLVLGS